VVVAVLIGGIEALGLIGDQLGMQGAMWAGLDQLNNNFGVLGSIIIGVFAASWIVSILIYRWNRYDEIEVNTGPVV
jgi:high-affinity nickel-transport protein